MLKNSYQIKDTLHENSLTVVYRAIRLSDKRSVIIKMLKDGEMNEYRIAQFINEQNILKLFNGPNVSKLLEVVATPLEYAHIFEDIGGSSLYDLLLTKRFTLEESLKIALDIAEAMEMMHHKHIIHADLNPKNIIYNLQTQELQVIDFGYSIIDDNFRYNSELNTGTSGNLMYMSPEQTGRIKQKIDHRSDFYSFGMTLYHLFANRTPFAVEDRFELIHKQIALYPQALNEVVENFPLPLASIIQKLIAKKPQSRYQQGKALIYDLKKSLQLLNVHGEIESFEIATQDTFILQVGDVLFGRETEITQLKMAVETITLSSPSRIFVSGESGVGKTRLIEEFFGYLKGSGAYILRAKFEQNNFFHPLLTLRELVMQIKPLLFQRQKVQKLVLNEQSINALISVFPDLKEILPKATQRYSRSEANKHLPFAIHELLEYAASKGTPIVVFLDDIQWTDNTSVELLRKVLLQSKNDNIHIVFSYRDTSIANNPKVIALLDAIKIQAFSKKYFFDLKPLKEKDIETLLKSFFGSNHKDIVKITSILFKKTLGNPLHLKASLERLVASGAIFYGQESWQCHIEQIKALSASLDIAQLIVQRLKDLSYLELQCLQILALLGNRFYSELTYEIIALFGISDETLMQLEAKGFIEFYDERYQFIHDILQYHALKLMKFKEQNSFHKVIGTYLESKYRQKNYNDIIRIVLHLNKAFESGYKHKNLESLNLQALTEMLQVNSYVMALELLQWMERHNFESTYITFKRSDYFNYLVLKTKILYLNKLHGATSQHISWLIKNTQNIEEKLVCFGLYKDLCVTKGNEFEELLIYGNKILTDLNIVVPITQHAIEDEVTALNRDINIHPLSKKLEATLHLKEMKNKKKKMVVALLVEYWEAAYYLSNIPLMQWSYLHIIKTSYNYGNISGSAFGYVLYGAQMISQGAYKQGYAFGKLAIQVNTHFNDRVMLPKIYNFMANFISPYMKGFDANRALYKKSLLQSKVNSDIVFGTWANFLMHLSDYFEGKSLDVLHKSIMEQSDWILNSGDQKMIAIFHVLKSTLLQLQEKSQSDVENESQAILLWEEEKFYPGLAWYGILKAQTCWIKGEYEQGLEYLTQYVHSDANEVIMFAKLRLHPLRALLLLGKKLSRTTEEEALLEHDIRMCEDFAKAAPKHFRYWKLLINAKRASKLHTHWDVAKMFDAAFHKAKKIENPFAIAVVARSIGRFWKTKGFGDVSRFYFSEATVGFNQWGAYATAVSLKDKSNLMPQMDEKELGASSSSSLFRTEPNNFRSLLKAFYALSQSADKKELLERLIQAILENANANKAVLIFKEGDFFYVVVKTLFTNLSIELEHTRLSEASCVPHSIVHYAIETHHKIVVNEPSQNGQFQYDSYFDFHTPASCMAVPASIEGSVLGVLYLENEEVSTPLHPNTVQTLQLLLTQASIVYKNALLYETLKKSDALLKKAQQISHVGSWVYDMADRTIEWSEETYRIYELEPYSILINQDWVMQHIHPDDMEIIMASHEKVVTGQPYCDVINRIVTAEGNIRVVHQRGEVYWEDDHQKISGTIQDITETRQAEEMIKVLSQVVSQTPFAVVITDPNGVIEYVNNQTLQLTGYFQSEIIGQNMSFLQSGIHPTSFYQNLWHVIKDKRENWKGILVNKIKNGTMKDFATTIFPIIDEKGVITNYVSIQDDVTERNIKDKLFLMQTRQAQMGEMLSMIAHQWRQPLSIMSAHINRHKINIMLEKASFSDILEGYNDIEIQIQHLSRTITDFKDFFKPDKQMVLSKSSTIINKTLDLVEHSLMNKGIQIKKCVGIDEEYQAYENELVQVLLNLIKNAQDAFEEHVVTKPIITITADQEEQDIFICVEDNAGGIKQEMMETLFAPYSSTKKDNGTGLGLYMSKIILQEHCNGDIFAKNTLFGASFTLRFPKA